MNIILLFLSSHLVAFLNTVSVNTSWNGLFLISKSCKQGLQRYEMCLGKERQIVCETDLMLTNGGSLNSI
jgi:hypothetical protein